LEKRSLTIAGHRTSIAIEREFWDGLEQMADATGRSIAAVIADIDHERQAPNLSSAVRLAVLAWYRDRAD